MRDYIQCLISQCKGRHRVLSLQSLEVLLDIPYTFVRKVEGGQVNFISIRMASATF